MPTATDDARGLHLRLTLSSGSTASSAGGPTSFKRSLEELFGGAESDGEGERSRSSTGSGGGMTVGGGNGGGGGSSNGRNKRPRSESAEQASASPSSSSSSSSAANGRGLSLPPRLPTPRLDVHMSDIPLLDSSAGLEFSPPQRRRQHHRQQSSSSRSLPSPLPSASVPASTSASPPSSTFTTTQQTNLTLSAIHNTITSAHATTTVISTLGLGPSSIATSSSPISSSSLPLPSSSSSSSSSSPSSSSSAPSFQSRSDRSSSPGLILPLPLSRSIQTPPATTNIAGNLPLPSPTTSIGIISGTDTGAIINETEASPNIATAVGVADMRGPEERFRATMQRYNVFENEIAVLRRSVSPPGLRSLTVGGMGGHQQQQQQTASPPRLPPLELSSLRVEGDDEGDDVDEEEEDRVRPLGPVRHGHVTSTSSGGSERLSTSPALHLPDRGAHLEPFFTLPTAAEISPLPYDEDVDELEDDEDMSNHQHHQHQRISAPLLIHGHSNRPVRAAVPDTPPRIELSNAVWSSLDIGSDATPPTSTRGVTTTLTATNHDRLIGAEENEDDGNDVPEDDHNIDVYPRFRDHLDSALEALRSPSSPLVPGLVPSGIESSNTLTSVPNNDHEPRTTINLNDPGSHHPSRISLSPPSAIPSTLSSSSLAFSSNVRGPLRDSPSQGISNPASSSSLSGAVPVAVAGAVRRLGRPPTLPPILTEPTNLSSSSSSSRRGDGRYSSHRLMMPSSSPRERDEQLTRIRRRVSIGDDNGQGTTSSRGTLQRSSNLGEVHLPSPSLSEFYDWLGSPDSPDPDLLRDAITPMASEGNYVGRSSRPSREQTREQREREVRDGELERRTRRSWEEDVLSGFGDTNLGLDLNLRQREQRQQQQGQISLPPSLPPPARPTLERRLSVDGGVVGMDVDMEPSDDLEARQRELELERLPWTLGSSIVSSTTRTNQLSPQFDPHHESRRSTSSIQMSRSRERLRLYNDVEIDNGWNPMHSTRHWHSESNPATSTSPAISSLPTFSSSLFSAASPPPSTIPHSTAAHHPHPPPSSTAVTSSGTRPRLPDFLLSHRGGRNHLFPLSRRSSNATPGVGRERRSSGESNDSLPPSLELNLSPSNYSVFGTSAGGGPRASGTAGEGIRGQHEHSLISTPSSSSSSLTPFLRLFEPPTAVPPPSLGQQVPLLSSQPDHHHHHQNQRQRNTIEIEVLGDGDGDDVEDVIDEILNDDRERQPPEQSQHLLLGEDGERRQRQPQQEREQQHRYRPHTRVVGSDNSLVAENATETRRLYARMDVARRLHHGSSNTSRRSSGRSWASSVEEESLRNVDDEEDLRNSTYHDAEGGREERVGETSERQRRVRALASQIQHHRRQRPDANGRQASHYEDLLSRRFMRQFPDLFDGIGMPPRVTNSSGGGNTSSSNDRVSGPRIVPPPPRPRLHSIRHVLIPSEDTGSGNGRGDDDNGHGSSMPWSQGGDNRDNNISPPSTAVANAPPHRMSSEGGWGTMFQLRSPRNHVSPVATTAAAPRPSITDSAARPSLDSLSSSDSSMTDSFTSSGDSSSSASGSNALPLRAPDRRLFLDTELPSPGLGGLFDSLVANSTATTTGPHTTTVHHSTQNFTANLSSAPSSVVAAAPTSEHYSSNSSSGFFSSATGRFTPSPVRTSDADLDEERIVADETARLHSLATRLGSMRDEMVSEMMNWWDRPEGGESEMRMDVGEGEQRGRVQNVHRAPITHRSSAGEFRRPGPFPPPSSTVAAPNTSTAGMAFSSSPNTNASSYSDRERRNHVIDPMLFAPGLFRNTVETLANGPREYAAQASSSVPSSSSFAAASRPAPAPATSISSPTMSSGFLPSQLTTPLPSPPYMLAPEQPVSNTFVVRPPPRRHYNHHRHRHHHGLSGGAQSPPVIPPLSFENDSSETATAATMAGARTRERSEVQEPLDSVANENEQMRQGYFSLLRRQRRDGTARRGDETSIEEGERSSNVRFSTSAAHPSFLPSSSPSSSSPPTPSERRQLSVAQLERLLERSPERSEYHTSPGSSSRAVENRFRSNMEAMRPAIERHRMRQQAVDEQRRNSERHWDVLRWRNEHNNPRPSMNNAGSRGDAPARNIATTDLLNTSSAVPDLTYDRVRRAQEIHAQTDGGATTAGGNNNNSERAGSHRGRWYDIIHNNLRSVYTEEGDEDDSDEDMDLETFTLQRRYREPLNFGPRMPLPPLESRLQGGVERERESSTTRHRLQPTPGYVGWSPPQVYERVGSRPRNVTVGGGQDTSRVGGGGSGGAPTAAGAMNDFNRPFRLRERAMHRLRASTLTSANNGSGGNGVFGMMRLGRPGRRFGDLGDYMNDDDFDASYESLLSLQEALGDVRPKSTPEAVLKKLKTGKYKEWVEQGGEIRCPICLEDYNSEDVLLKSGNCTHWMHKACLEEWFKGANTCPVCRTQVEPRPHSRFRCGRHGVLPRRNPGSGGGGGSGSGNGGGGGSGSAGGSAGDPSGSGSNGNGSGAGPGSNSPGRGGAFGGREFW